MQKPLELLFRDIPKSDATIDLINTRVEKLERICDHITTCRVTLSKPQTSQETGNPFQVMIEVRIPPGHDLVVRRDPGDMAMHDALDVVVRDAFSAMERQVKELMQRQRKEVKTAAQQDSVAIVEEIFTDEEHGFLRTLDGRSVYFHKNAVINDDWERLEVGTGVRYVEEIGEEGLQASTVQIVDKPGVRRPKVE